MSVTFLLLTVVTTHSCRLAETIFSFSTQLNRIVRRDFKAFVQESTDEDGNELEKLIEKQNREYFDIYDKIVKNLPKKHQLEMLKLNGQFIPEAKSEVFVRRLLGIYRN